MSHDWPQYKLRIPQELKGQVGDLAKTNNRSINAEIISRLEKSLLIEAPSTELLTAEQANAIACQSRTNRKAVIIERCTEEISKAIRLGVTEVWVTISEYEDPDWCEDSLVFKDVLKPVINTLDELGYSVEIKDHSFVIKF